MNMPRINTTPSVLYKVLDHFFRMGMNIHSISIRAGKVTVRADDDKYQGTVTLGTDTLQLAGEYSVLQVKLK